MVTWRLAGIDAGETTSTIATVCRISEGESATRSFARANVPLFADRVAAFLPVRARDLKDLPAVLRFSKQEDVGPADIDVHFAGARQREIRPERAKLLVDVHLGHFDSFVVAGTGALPCA